MVDEKAGQMADSSGQKTAPLRADMTDDLWALQMGLIVVPMKVD
jgi:hypothetical protein